MTDKNIKKMIKKGKLPDGKILCEKCSALIDEGLAFCPECGERIPEFMRFALK